MGVGAHVMEKSIESTTSVVGRNDELRKQILSFGRNKKRKNLDDEVDDDDDTDGHNSNDDDDDDEEGGRTTIKLKEKKKFVMDNMQDIMEKYNTDQTNKTKKKKKKKKKKGKKERQADKIIEEEPTMTVMNEQNQPTNSETTDRPMNSTKKEEILSTESISDNKQSDKDGTKEMNDKPVVPSTSQPPPTTTTTKKRKKPKVRSKQKNIKKDSRPSSQKPEHLRIGTKEYAGRPLTAQTRSFLSIPPSRTQRIRAFKASLKNEEERNKQGYETFETGGLAVDDLLADTMNDENMDTNVERNMETMEQTDKEERNDEVDLDLDDGGELINNNKENTEMVKGTKPKKNKKKKPKKKSKYKNLR